MSDGAACDRLTNRRIFERWNDNWARQCFGHSTRHEKNRANDADRQQNARNGLRQIDIKIAQRSTRQPANKGNAHCQPRCG